MADKITLIIKRENAGPHEAVRLYLGETLHRTFQVRHYSTMDWLVQDAKQYCDNMKMSNMYNDVLDTEGILFPAV
ncbi:hypothetical protein [Methylotenera sp.]|uniref:hypothetical protein n=1 Tax=Methylotenera sp. TaxID=2051956 RepID=UPI002ED78C10